MTTLCKGDSSAYIINNIASVLTFVSSKNIKTDNIITCGWNYINYEI
jgi:hypothetical protein